MPWIIFDLRRSQVFALNCTSSIASFKPGSIVPRSPSIFVDSSSSCVVDLRLIAGFPRFLLAFATSLEYPRIFLYSRAFCRPTSPRWISRAFCWPSPRRRNTRAFCITRAFWISRASVDLRRVAGFPALSSIVGPSQFPRFLRSARSSLDLPRLRSPAFHAGATLLSSHSIGAIVS